GTEELLPAHVDIDRRCFGSCGSRIHPAVGACAIGSDRPLRERIPGWPVAAARPALVVRLDLADALAPPGGRAVVHAAQLPAGERVTGGDAGAVELTRLLCQCAGLGSPDSCPGVSADDPRPSWRSVSARGRVSVSRDVSVRMSVGV